MQRPTSEGLERTWIALDKAINGYWECSRCVLAPAKGDVLAIETEDDAMRVSLRQRTVKGFADRKVWIVRLDEDCHNVLAIAALDGKDAPQRDVGALNDLLWQYHRLAVEDAVRVIRN